MIYHTLGLGKSRGGKVSRNEKTSWITLASIFFVFVPYFYKIFFAIGIFKVDTKISLGLFIGAAVLSTFVAIVSEIILAALDPDETTDEREKMIGLRSSEFGYWTLSAGALTIALHVMGVMNWKEFGFEELSGAGVAQLLLAAFVLAEIVKYSSAIFLYRQGTSDG